MFSFYPSYSYPEYDSYYVDPYAAALAQARERRQRLLEARRREQEARRAREHQAYLNYLASALSHQNELRYGGNEEDDDDTYSRYAPSPRPTRQPASSRRSINEKREQALPARRFSPIRPQSPVRIPVTQEPQSNNHSTPVSRRDSASPSPPIKAAPVSDVATLNEAASKIQQTWHTYRHRRHALAQINSIRSSFHSLRDSFAFPSRPDFDLDSVDQPKLLYTPTNKPIHAYEHSATQLLTRLDAVESGGDHFVREARKALVDEIECNLKQLEDKKVSSWHAQLVASSSELSNGVGPEAEALTSDAEEAVDEKVVEMQLDGQIEDEFPFASMEILTEA